MSDEALATGIVEAASAEAESVSDEGARPALTITEAARAAGVDRRTIRRRLDAGDLPNAYRDPPEEGAWQIPVTDLIAAALPLHRPLPAHQNDEAEEWCRRALVAEAVAEERERTIAALERALLALEAGPAPAPASPEAVYGPRPRPVKPEPPPEAAPAARRHWWQGRPSA